MGFLKYIHCMGVQAHGAAIKSEFNACKTGYY